MNETQNKRGRKPKEKFSIFSQRLLSLILGSFKNLNVIAEEMGITRQSLAQYRDGNNIPDALTLAKIADYFNVSADYLLGRTDVKSMNLDVKAISDKTGLSESSAETLLQEKSLLETETLNSFLEADIYSFLDVCFDLIPIIEYKASREVALKQFVKKNNLPITDEMIEEQGEYVFKGVFDEMTAMLKSTEFNDYFKHTCWKLSLYSDEDYKEFLLQKAVKQLCDEIIYKLSNSSISEYFKQHYSKVFALEEEGKHDEALILDSEKLDYISSISGKKAR